ncbi:MAG: threonine-phosphate decarboxylase [Marinilabiliaceae bacterium]
MIEGHGDDLHKFGNVRANFSSNINPEGPPAELIARLKDSLSNISSYPEPLAATLARRLEYASGLGEGTVLITAGAVEAFYLLAHYMRNKRSLIYTPSFSEYADACRLAGHQVDFREHWKFEDDDPAGMDMVWICNPNNPDGRLYGPETICHRVRENPQTLFVVDEAYIDFTLGDFSLINEIQKFPNLVVVRSMTKRYAIPGLRLGYVAAGQLLTESLEQDLMPWRINSLALEAGMFCTEYSGKEDFPLAEWLQESRRLQKAIDAIDGFQVQPSETLFFLVKGPEKASLIKEKLARDEGLLIRDASNFRGLTPYHFRISVQTPEKNDWLIQALRSWS